jgi:predicted nucleic acid-binding protein
MIYLDTSAATKLVRAEAESAALSLFLAERASTPMASSALLYPELIRVVCRVHPDLERKARILLQRIMQVPINRELLSEAATIGEPMLRTLDALHLATATNIVHGVTAFVTYDKRLAAAAQALGLPVEAPA